MQIFDSREGRFVDRHLSASQLDMFFRCGQQWYYRYIEGLMIPPGIAAHVGSGVHKASEVNFGQKIETGEDLPLDDVRDAARDGYMHRLTSDGVYLSREEQTEKDRLLNDGLNQAVSLAELMMEAFAPVVEPVAVERKIKARDPVLGVEWVAYLDLEQTNTLHDIKTASKKWTQDQADRSTQFTLYPYLVELADKRRPEQLEFDVFVKSKSKADYQTLFTERDDSDLDALRERATTMLELTEQGHAPPAAPGSWICSPRFCGYFGRCKYIPDRLRRLPNR